MHWCTINYIPYLIQIKRVRQVNKPLLTYKLHTTCINFKQKISKSYIHHCRKEVFTERNLRRHTSSKIQILDWKNTLSHKRPYFGPAEFWPEDRKEKKKPEPRSQETDSTCMQSSIKRGVSIMENTESLARQFL